MLDEVDDDTTQRLVVDFCSVVVHADREIDAGESVVLLAAIEHRGLHPDDQISRFISVPEFRNRHDTTRPLAPPVQRGFRGLSRWRGFRR